MFHRFMAGIFAILFVAVLEHASAPRIPRPRRLLIAAGLLALVLAVSLIPLDAHASAFRMS
jgi:hypothetical protein